MKRYGCEWPDNSNPLQLEFACIRRGGRWLDDDGYACGAGLYQHYLNAWQLLWPEDDHHRWEELGLRRICENDITVIMGPSDSSKTSLIAKFVMCDYWVDPLRTLWMTSSTDRRGAELRIWGKLKEFFNRGKARFPGLPGRVLESKACITPDEIDDDGEIARLLTRGIIFIPCRVGTTFVGLQNYAGIKPPPGGRMGHAGDECFPQGQIVNTPEGGIPIELVQPGQWIINAGGIAQVEQHSLKIAPRLVRLWMDDGRCIDCTPDHPFLTEQGWQKAVDIPLQTKLFSTHDTLSNLPEGVTGENLSDEILFQSLPKKELGKEVCQMRQPFHSVRTTSDLLFPILCGSMEMGAAGNAGEIPCGAKGDGSGRTFTEGLKSNFGECGGMPTAAGQNERHATTHEGHSADQGTAGVLRRARKDQCRNDSLRTVSGSDSQLQGQHGREREASPTALLPVGSGVAGNQAQHRIGRVLSPDENAASQGRLSGPIHEGPRLVRIESIKSESDSRYHQHEGGYRVHNLKIKGHHSYSVNGVIVRNCSLMQPSFLDAYANWYGKENFRGLLTGNPGDLEDPLCKAAEPVDGWESFKDTDKTQEWRSRFYNAWVIAYDGLDTPNNDFPYVNGRAHYSYLIGKKKLDAVRAHYGENDWHWFNQCKGKPQTSVQSRRVITRQLVKSRGATDDVIWASGDQIKSVVSLDAAYGGIGGDRCVIRRSDFGPDVEGNQIFAVSPPVIVPVSVRNDETPEIQIARFCKTFCEIKGIPPESFFFDGRGTLAITLAQEWSPNVNVVDFGGPATSRPVSNDEFIWEGDTQSKRLKRCDEEYFNFVTELWFAWYQLILCGQMRRLDKETMQEGFLRTWDHGSARMRRTRKQVEPKDLMKERTKQSPDLADCFVGDTLIQTISGPKRIDAIKPGEMVITPFGPSPVMKIHERDVNEITTATFSNGASLSGKGKHKIFTWNRGWTRLDALSTCDEVESLDMLWQWNLLNAFCTKAKSTGFKAAVDIIHATKGRIERSDFYTGLSGLSTKGQSQRECACIILTMTGRTTGLRILSLLPPPSTGDYICEPHDLISQSTSQKSFSRELLRQPKNGMDRMLEGNGTGIMGSRSGLEWNRKKQPVLFAASNSMHSLRGRNSAQFHVGQGLRESEQLRIVPVWSAAAFSQFSSTLKPAIVPVTVRPSRLLESRKVYNLTLLEHNAYYANGILVDNCLVISIEGARRLGFQIQSLKGGTVKDGANPQWIENELAKRKRFLKASELSYTTT